MLNYVIATRSQQIYTRAYLLLYLLSGGMNAPRLSAWHLEPYILSNESGISERLCPKKVQREGCRQQSCSLKPSEIEGSQSPRTPR